MSVTVLKLTSGEEIIANVVDHSHLIEYLRSRYVTIGYEASIHDAEYGVIVMRPCIFESQSLVPWILGAKVGIEEFFIPGQHVMFELKKNDIDKDLYEKYVEYMRTWK